MNLEQRINHALDSGMDTFWVHIRNQFPEAKTGDLSPGTAYDLEVWMQKAVEEWVETNVPKTLPKTKYYVQRTKVEVIEVEAYSGEVALELAQANWDFPGWATVLDTDVEFDLCDHKGRKL
jgi:hypothetical protein